MTAAWSPDGRRLAFSVSRHQLLPGDEGLGPAAALFTVDLNGSRPRQLTPWSAPLAVVPDWSPDGKTIAYERYAYVDGAISSEVMAVSSAGGEPRRIGSGTKSDAAPAWSPDGRWIAFHRAAADPAAAGEIWLMRPDGTAARRIAKSGRGPAWSPDGKRIAFASIRDRNGATYFDDGRRFNAEIYVMNADGTGQRRLTRNRADDRDPDWAPDGGSIVFDSGRLSRERFGHHLWIMRADGRCQRPLLSDPAWALQPAWQPGRPGVEVPTPPCRTR